VERVRAEGQAAEPEGDPDADPQSEAAAGAGADGDDPRGGASDAPDRGADDDRGEPRREGGDGA